MPLTLTPSNATWLATCAKRFDRLAVKKQYPAVRSQRSSVLSFSSACHQILRHLYDPLTPGPLPHSQNLATYVRMAFLQQHFYNKDEAARELDMHRAHRIISRYLDEDEDANCTTAVELSGNFPIELSPGKVAFHVSARLDRILIRPDAPDTLIVRDYKVASSLRPLDPIQIFINLAVAKLAHQSAFKYHVLELTNLTDDGFETTTYHSRDLKGIHKHVAALVQRYEISNRISTYPKRTLPILPAVRRMPERRACGTRRHFLR